MKIQEISADEYRSFLEYRGVAFMSAEFNELNKYKADEVIYLLFEDSKPRFVLCFGIKSNEMLCPYSAPFGMLVPLRESTSLEYFDLAVKEIDNYASCKGIGYIKMILPPFFYDEDNISMLVWALYSNGYSIKNIDLNYQFCLDDIDTDEYKNTIQHNARKNLRIGLQAGLTLERCSAEEECKEAYDIIRLNRESKGFPLRMTYEQVSETVKIIENDFFIVRKNGTGIASAIIFHISPETAQVIYWGDIPGYSQDKPVNYLSYNLIEYYKKRGFKYLDIGPSTEHGVPNFGLCNFKQSIGCTISNKFTFEKYYGKTDNVK